MGLMKSAAHPQGYNLFNEPTFKTAKLQLLEFEMVLQRLVNISDHYVYENHLNLVKTTIFQEIMPFAQTN